MRNHPDRNNSFKKYGKCIYVTLLFMIPFVLIAYSFAIEMKWRKEFNAKVDGQKIDCAFAGGMEFSKPTVVDIDRDGDPDLFIGDEEGKILYFRNEGNSQNPRWNFVSEFRDSSIAERSSPAFADIDDDGDWDLFVGNRAGKISFFRNDGNISSPIWTYVLDFYNSIDVGSESAPVLVDIDADLDLDMFVGADEGTLSFYRNVGTKNLPAWHLISSNYDSLDVGASSTPAFADMDADGDLDLFVGEEQGNINFYRNAGCDTASRWELVSTNYNSIDVGRRSFPVFVDIDDDSDLDLFIGEIEGKVFFYRNDGSIYLPSWTFLSQNYLFIDVGAYTRPTLADIDGDGDGDLFVGEEAGNINFYRNEESFPVSSWSKITENYFAIEADNHSSPTFADIDGDGDLDLFIGKNDGTLDFYENIGDAETPLWILRSNQYNLIDVGSYSSPVFANIDGDSDLDLFVGERYGKIYYYRNDGTSQNPLWTLVSQNFNSIDVDDYCVPTFGDLDLDGDYDLLLGNDEGKISFYRNDGTSHNFSFVFSPSFYDSIDVGERSTPVLCNFDSDGDWDLFVGESKGGLHFYKNLSLNSIRGRVTDEAGYPVINAVVYLTGAKEDSTFTDSSGNYAFVGLPSGYYCVFRDPAFFQYCFTPLNSDTFNINFVGTTQVESYTEQDIPQSLQLFPNYPNPFNPVTNICYFLPIDQEVKLTIYNLMGEKVTELMNGFQAKGWKKIIWDGKDSQGKEIASGIYFCRLETYQGCQTIRLILLK